MNRDYITITGLEIYAYHGVYEQEQQNGQRFFINARLYYNMKKPGKSDALADAVNYASCCEFIAQRFSQSRFDLIEAAAERLCEEILCEFPLIREVEMEVCKPEAPIGLPFSNVSVHMRRGWHTAYLSVGSNMGDRQAYIDGAVAALKERRDVRGVCVSNLIQTKPYGPVEQDDFLNGCIRLETLLDPEELLDVLHEMEHAAGRVRKVHWGPRTLDLDIIFYDKLVYESDTLIIPHIDMENRRFVLEPLAQLAPNYRHPILNKTVGQLFEDVMS